MGPWTVPGQPTPHAVAAGDVITGTITLQSNGDPLPGMRVQLFASNYGADILVTETTTDASGDYTLEGDQLCGTVFVQDPSGVLAYDQQWQCGSGTVD
ncbi:MAG: carboxypeptidase-like regulatory domain-containing protein, partial [Actinomycetota bacterium]|nr:carboxypeptidase-like regulatory domain-containing protein [Actinomycetota bacterium]